MSDLPYRTDRVRMLIFLKRKEGMTHEEFSRYWIKKHAPLFASLHIVKKNILKYEQAHTNPISGGLAEKLGLSAPDFDGAVVLEAESVDKIVEALSSAEYAEKIVPDEAKFIDRPKCQILVQQLYSVIGARRDT